MTIDKPRSSPYSKDDSGRDHSSSSERSHARDVLPPPYSKDDSGRGHSSSSERPHAYDVVRDSSPTQSSDSRNPGLSTDSIVGEREFRNKGKQKETTGQQEQRMRENQDYYDRLTSLSLDDMVSRVRKNAIRREQPSSHLSLAEKEQQILTELQCVRDKIAQLEAHPSASASSSQEGSTSDREMLKRLEERRSSELRRIQISKRSDQYLSGESSLREERLPAEAKDYLEKLRLPSYENATSLGRIQNIESLGTIRDIEERYSRAEEGVSDWKKTLMEHQRNVAEVRRDMILQRTGISPEKFGTLEELAETHLTEDDHKDLDAFMVQKKSYENKYEKAQYEHTWRTWSEFFYLKGLREVFEKEQGQHEKARNDELVARNREHEDKVKELKMCHQRDLIDLGTQFMKSMQSPNISRTDREALQNNHEQVKEKLSDYYVKKESAEDQRLAKDILRLEKDYFSSMWDTDRNMHLLDGMINKRTGLKGNNDVAPRYEAMTTQYSPPYDENREQSSLQRPENTFEQQVTDWGRAGMRALRRLW